MKLEKALEIISMIADGYDPYNGMDSNKELPELNPITIRALCVAIVSLLRKTDKTALMENYKAQQQIELAEQVTGPLQQHLFDNEKEKIQKALNISKLDFGLAANEMRIKPEELEQRIEILGLKNEIELLAMDKSIVNDYQNVVRTKGLEYYLSILEKNTIKAALEKSDYNKNEAAEILGTTFRSLRYRIAKIFVNQRPEYFILNDEIVLDFFKYPEISVLDEFMHKVERKLFEKALEESELVKTKAAELLGITFRSFRYKIEKLGTDTICDD